MTNDEILALLAEYKILLHGIYEASKYRFAPDHVKQNVTTFMKETRPSFKPKNFAEMIYWLHHDLYIYPKACPICISPITHFHSFPIGYKRDFCSNRCAQLSSKVRDKIVRTNFDRRGVAHQMHDKTVTDKIAETNLAKYGVINVFANDHVKRQIKQTIQERFGQDNVSKSDIIKLKKVETCRKNFSIDYAVLLPENRPRSNNHEQAVATCMQRYNVTNVAHIPDVISRRVQSLRTSSLPAHAVSILMEKTSLEALIQTKTVVDVAVDLGVAFSTVYNQINRLGIIIPSRPHSRPEQIIFDNLTKLNAMFVCHDRTLLPNNQEIDFLLRNNRLGIECDGLYHHSELFKNRLYHLQKTQCAATQGIRLLHFFEDEILFKTTIVQSKISGLLGLSSKVMARKCELVLLTANQANQFLESSHLQGKDQSSVRFGLMLEDTLICAMTFVRSRYDKHYQWELSRYAALPFIHISGGASRLLMAFIRQYHPRSIITYADRRLSVGGLYEQLGFTWLHDTTPNYFYIVGQHRENRQRWQKHLLDNKLKVFDPSLSEAQNMRNNKIYRIYDCGHHVYGMHF